jgi:glycosyltransferase involved in cell wall biosynthesis
MHVDLVEFEDLRTASYRSAAGDTPTILREHNVEYLIWRRHAQHAASLAERAVSAVFARRIERYEARVASTFNRCIVVTDVEAGNLRRISPKADVHAIPSGVDTEFFRPQLGMGGAPATLTITGSFSWRPKQLNLQRLATQIFPRIRQLEPRARLVVVGRGLDQTLRRELASIEGVEIIGEVSDVRPYIARSTLMINYAQSGGGIALKVLEAMAMRKPVLANQLGCEGIEARDGVEISIARDDREFIERALSLLRDEAERGRLADRGYELVERQYAWHRIAPRFSATYEHLLAARRTWAGRGS